MAIAHVQSAQNAVSPAAETNAKAFVSDNTAGNLIIVAVQWVTTAQTVTVADSLGNTYQAATSQLDITYGALQIWYAMNVGAGANTVTATFNGTTTSTMAIHEYSGLVTTSALDKTAGASGASATASDSGATATTTQAGELLFGATQVVGTSGGFTAGAGYTQRISSTGRLETEDQVVGAVGAYNATATWVTSRTWSCQIATFKGTAAPAVATPVLNYTQNLRRRS
jgi:hypothetical protein